MKRVLIAGRSSYIGEHLSAWLGREPEAFQTQCISLRGDDWRQFSMAGFDTVVLVAGIAHQKETAENEPLYNAVNHVLAVDVAAAAKAAGVKQFVFFSSMSVYGRTVGRIHADTRPSPNTAYGASKFAAEQELASFADDTFHVAILRPPMVYGKGCRGNYPRLSVLIRKLPVFPRVPNERSMVYIDTLCAFLQLLVESGKGGLYFPQNREYVTTDELAKQISLAYGKRLWQPRGFGWLLKRLALRGGTAGKVFGTLTYDQTMSDVYRPAQELPFAETIRATEAET